jgi:hypothetical protein
MTDKEIDELLAAHGYVLGGEGMRQALELIPSGLAPLVLFFALDVERLMRDTRQRILLRHCVVARDGTLVLTLQYIKRNEIWHLANQVAAVVRTTSLMTCQRCADTSAGHARGNLVLCKACQDSTTKLDTAQALAREQRQCA